MSLARYFGWGALAVATLAVAAGPDLVTLPEPAHAIVVERGDYQPNRDSAREMALPLAIFPSLAAEPEVFRYHTYFDLSAVPSEDLFVFIPTINRRVSLVINGQHLYGGVSAAFWLGPISSTTVFLQLPNQAVHAGRNELTLVVEPGPFMFPVYLSRIFIGTDAALGPSYALRTFLNEQLKTMVTAAHLLLSVGLIFAYFFRPKDPLFAWLAAFNTLTLLVATGLLIGFQPAVQNFISYILALVPASFILFVGVAMALVNIRPPRFIYLLAIAVTCALLPLAAVGSPPTRTILAVTASAMLIAAMVVSVGIMAWSAIRRTNADVLLVLFPSALFAWYSVRDVYITATLPQHPFNLLLPYARPLFLATLTIVLMRRMASSLDQLDSANETLNKKLAEREAELAVLARQERVESGHRIREQERQRLTHDLHDGISGHLASIIALSERAGELPIEQAAREALNDLRLVIYSLDLGDRELPLALANFRERLVPQLQRLGVVLDWSIAGLPDVSGVTPGNALAVLRILQEAITNAVKHGPARHITIRGGIAADDRVAITIENDGGAFVENGTGHGLANMRRRAHHLRGELKIESIVQGVKLTLLLPASLPDFEDEVVV